MMWEQFNYFDKEFDDLLIDVLIQVDEWVKMTHDNSEVLLIVSTDLLFVVYIEKIFDDCLMLFYFADKMIKNL